MFMNRSRIIRAAAFAAVLFLLSAHGAAAARSAAEIGETSANFARSDLKTVQISACRNACRSLPQPSHTASCSACRTDAANHPLHLSAKSAVLLDAFSGRLLYASHETDRALIASTTKIMTALLLCESGNLDQKVVIPPEAVGVEGSSLYLKSGEVLTVRELLYGLMLRSGNDAAVALALADSGDLSSFSRKMNEKANILGLENTHYSNPHGLDSEENYSTALDLARLTRYALQNEAFLRLVSTKSIQIGDRQLTNHNKLLWQYPGAIGVKTGYTRTAGRILVSAAERNGRRLIAVTIADPNDWADHAALLDYGFSQYETCHLVSQGDVVGSIPVIGGICDYVNLTADFPFEYPLSSAETPTFRLLAPHQLFAPCGALSATLEIWLDGIRIGAIPLSLAEPVLEKPPQKSIFQRIFGG